MVAQPKKFSSSDPQAMTVQATGVSELLSRVQLCVTPWTVAHQAPLSMGLLRQERWSGLPFPFPEDLSCPGVDPASPAPQADPSSLSHLGSLK